MSDSNCSLRASFRNRRIESILDEALNAIKETLYQSANFVKEVGLFQYSDFGLKTTLYPGLNRVTELDDVLYNSVMGPGSRGNYNPDCGRIFLKRGSWCRKTFIHETLHSVSIFAADQNKRIGMSYPFINEGITEFFTGYVLWQKYRQCFDAWKNKSYQQVCELRAYEDMVRIWYAFCKFVDFKEVIKLYFGNGSFDWNKAWNGFVSSINSADYVFEDPLRGSTIRFQDTFVDQCRKAFGRNQFNEILEYSDLDYGLITSS